MEILKFLLDFFIKNQNSPTLNNIFELLKSNSFDLKNIINNFSIEKAMQIFENFMGEKQKNDFNLSKSPNCYNTNVINDFCDEEICFALNSYINA